MKTIINSIFLLFIIAASPCYAQDTTKSEVKFNHVDAKGMKQGRWVQYHASTKAKRYEGTFKDNRPIGTFVYYDEFGKKASELKHFETHDTVIATYFHFEGTVMSKGKYLKQQRHGKWEYFDNQGRVSALEFYENGKQEGMQYVFYANARVAKQTHFKNGLEQGECKEFFDDGVLKFQGNYLNGNLNGLVTYYHPNGVKRFEGTYANAVRDGRWIRYNAVGKPEFHEIYVKGHVMQVIDLEEEKRKRDSLNQLQNTPKH